MINKTKRLKELYNENSTAFKSLIKTEVVGMQNVLETIENIIINAGIDKFIYTVMEDDILKGNFDVIYLDDRIIGEDKKRIKAKKELNRIRCALLKMKHEGKEIFEILFE